MVIRGGILLLPIVLVVVPVGAVVLVVLVLVGAPGAPSKSSKRTDKVMEEELILLVDTLDMRFGAMGGPW